MKRSGTSDLTSGSKRFEAYQPSTQFQQQQQPQQHLNVHQQQQIQAQQHIQHQQFQAQQQQYQDYHQMQVAQQQQQQFAANQQYFNQRAFFPNYQQYTPPQAQMMYNNSPSWTYITPPPFYTPPQQGAASSPQSQPPLPPPDMKPEKPPLPKDPEPGKHGPALRNTGIGMTSGPPPGVNFNGPGAGLRAPGSMARIRVRGLNGINNGINNLYNGFGGEIRGQGPTGNAGIHGTSPGRGRRRNQHFPHQLLPMGMQGLTEYNEFSQLMEEDQPAGPEKLTIFLNNNDTGRVQVNKKAKRKPMSTRYARTKQWVLEEAEAAIALEKEFNQLQKRPMLILKFPDPDLNKYIVKKYSPSIDTVHFQQPSTPRYCFVQLKEDSDVEKVISTLRQIPFGTGTISAELKHQHVDDQPVTPEEIDPYTLYIGNLPTHISVRVVKQYFPNAQRIDIGYAQRMRYTRYAFIRYNTVSEAMESYRRTVNALLDSRSLIVRFRRQKGNIGLPGESKLNNAPRREGREVLPDNVPKPLEKDQSEELHDEEDFVGGLHGEVDDDEDDEGPETEEVNLKAIVVNPVAVTTDSESLRNATPPGSKNTTEDLRDIHENSNEPATSRYPVTEKLAKIPENSKDTSKGPTLSRRQSAEASNEPNISNETYSEGAMQNEVVDSKDNVLAEAEELMRRNKVPRQGSESPVLIGSFPPVKRVGIKPDPDESSSDSSEINLPDTRVKDEPCEYPSRPRTPCTNDPYQDDYDYDDMDGEPEEEDDEDWATNSDFASGGPEWDEFRRSELSAKENKPDLEQLNSKNNPLESKQALPIAVNLEPKPEFCDDESLFDQANKTKRKKTTDTFNEKDDLHDMFAQLDSDHECEDDDAFLFG